MNLLVPNTELTDDSDAVVGVSATAMGEDVEEQDIVLTRDDVSFRTGLLTPVSHKWVEIAISLGLREHERANCKGETNIISLTNSLENWINNSKATLKKLTDTLSSKIVGEKTLSEEVKERSQELSRSGKKRKIIHSHEKSIQSLRIKKISPRCKVADDKSTLLHIQATPT